MVISHKYHFIFIKTLKTAGTSIEVFLSQVCGPTDVFTPIIPHVEPHLARNYDGYFNHIEAQAVREKVGPDVWNSYFKFCVERNPWEKILSYYYMKKHRENSNLSFDEYLAGSEFPVNYPKYTEPEDPDKIIVDKVLYYENLMDGLGGVFSQLGIAFNGSLGVNAKSEYRTNRQPYQAVYTPEQSRVVAEIFKQELLLHGYSY